MGAFVIRVLALDDGIVMERRGGADDAEGGGHRAWFGVVLVQKACRRRMEAIYRHFTAAVDMWLLGLSSSTHVRAEDHRSGRVGRGSLRRPCHRPWVA